MDFLSDSFNSTFFETETETESEYNNMIGGNKSGFTFYMAICTFIIGLIICCVLFWINASIKMSSTTIVLCCLCIICFCCALIAYTYSSNNVSLNTELGRQESNYDKINNFKNYLTDKNLLTK